MPSARQLVVALVLAAPLGVWPTPARADEELGSARALGMGDALRAAATGSAAVHLNPSGLTLIRNFVIGGGYQFRGADSTNFVEVSVADSIPSRVAAAVYFDYESADVKDGSGAKLGDRSGWESGVALALPLTEWLSLGLTPKYQSIDQPATGGGKAEGFTIDAGATLRPLSFLNIGLVGGNLVEQDSTRAPRTLGLGFALVPFPTLIVDFDMVFDFDSARLTMRPDQTETQYHFGGEYLLAQRLALRGGYVHDGVTGSNFAAFGASLVTPQLALDFGGRTQVDGPGQHATLFGVSLRLFLQ